MNKKSTNFELLRILLTIFIPIYHWFLYNGIFYADDSTNNLIGIGLFSGISFSCLYAFITMSSYFLIKKKNNWNAKKLYSFAALAITLHIFRTIFINALYPGEKMNIYVDDFFLHGAWWYVYPYILLMVFYPLLNYFIFHVSMQTLMFCTAIWGILFAVNHDRNHTHFINDCIMFVFIYLIMGCLERQKDIPAFFKKYKRPLLIAGYIICVVIFGGVSVYLKHPENTLALEVENVILQKFHGRYSILGLCSGIFIFTLFKDIKVPYIPAIHRISKITLFVFLLHESVMCVFWFFEIKSCEFLAYLPAAEFWGLLLIYMVCCILFAFVMHKIYYTFIEPLWKKLIDRLCDTAFTKAWENKYKHLQEK